MSTGFEKRKKQVGGGSYPLDLLSQSDGLLLNMVAPFVGQGCQRSGRSCAFPNSGAATETDTSVVA